MCFFFFFLMLPIERVLSSFLVFINYVMSMNLLMHAFLHLNVFVSLHWQWF